MQHQDLTFLPFDAVWKMRIEHPYSLLVKDGNLVWSCGQCPLDGAGEVLAPGDLLSQAMAVAGFIRQFLAEIGCDASAVGRLVVYYVKTSDGDAALLGDLFKAQFGREVLVAPIAIPYFYYAGMLIEVDVFGSVSPKRHRAFADDVTGARLDVVDTDSLSWVNFGIPRLPGDDATLASILRRLMEEAGLSPDRLLSGQWFVGSEKASQQVNSTRERLALDSCGVVDVDRDGLEAMAELTFSKAAVSHQSFDGTDRREWPEGVEITLRKSGDQFHIGGCDPTGAHGLVGQAQRIMRALEQVLRQSGLDFSNVRKATTYYVSGSSAEALHDNMAVRNRYYSKPGPASTGLPVKGFAQSKALISVKLVGTIGR
ncbi:hypothetical protein LGH82_30905 [Mesorhizobium sp. PAMC28654]|uniref:hypothetical protein n=1 Tax=Mesorhizobium sp. PAMC28654 TaxID=2880934 RepID=UPI001D0B659C|nr:hypothetical protein [Mesorhizobium sp. PAMC28654]UDL89419.1 hypothetical protein LGH82_30905 [Mesorhizobium sp. PAMC28654]